MKPSTFTQLFSRYLNEVARGHGYRLQDNPAVTFTQNCKKGLYNDLSDDDFDSLRQEVKDISDSFWLNAPNQSAADILRFALENIRLDENQCNEMAKIAAASCTSASVSPTLQDKSAETESTDQNVFDKRLADLLFPKDINISTTNNCSNTSTISPSYTNSSGYTSNYNSPTPDFSDTEEYLDNILDTPETINYWLSKHIYGQEKAVRAASLLLYNHINGRKRNILFAGPTGCGKTEIWRVCQKLYHDIRIIDCSMLTGEGWSGSFKVTNIFDNMNINSAERSIIVFDEFDKLCEPQISSSGSNYSFILQNELLKLIEGTILRTKTTSVNTANVCFVFCGSFEMLTQAKTSSTMEQAIGFDAQINKKDTFQIYESVLEPSDLVKYASVRQEIAGRINQIVQLSPMTAQGYKIILHDSIMSPLHQLERQYSIKLSLDKDTEDRLVQEAEKSRMGVRYLRSRIQQMLDDEMFQNCTRKEYTLSA